MATKWRKNERYRVGRMNYHAGPHFIEDRLDGVYVLAPTTPNAVCRAFSNDTAKWIARALTEYQAPRNRAANQERKRAATKGRDAKRAAGTMGAKRKK